MKSEDPKKGERCPLSTANEKMEPNRNIRVTSQKAENYLTEKQVVDYRNYRKTFIEYLLRMGKNPKKAEGYSPYSVQATARRCGKLDLWVWENGDGYRTPPTEEEAQAYMEEVAFRDIKESTKGKIRESLLRYSKWLQRKFNRDEWEFEWNFDSGGSNVGPRDFLTDDERHKIRQAALNYGDSWKFTSMVWVSLDAGLRPVEVRRARTSWIDVDNAVLRIPREESSKNVGNWNVGIMDKTANALEHWLEERRERAKYDDTDFVWLTKFGNGYGSNELSRLLKTLCDNAGVPYEDRQMSWYAIRHSTGTYMTKERDLAATKAQLRHRDVKTTMKYDQVPVEDRREALDKMG